MLSWIAFRLTGKIAGGAVAVALIIAGWQALEAHGARQRLASTGTALAAEKASTASLKATVATLRATIEAERAEAAAAVERANVACREEAARQYRAGQAAAGLSRNCVHDRGPAAVNRSLRDVLGEGSK